MGRSVAGGEGAIRVVVSRDDDEITVGGADRHGHFSLTWSGIGLSFSSAPSQGPPSLLMESLTYRNVLLEPSPTWTITHTSKAINSISRRMRTIQAAGPMLR